MFCLQAYAHSKAGMLLVMSTTQTLHTDALIFVDVKEDTQQTHTKHKNETPDNKYNKIVRCLIPLLASRAGVNSSSAYLRPLQVGTTQRKEKVAERQQQKGPMWLKDSNVNSIDRIEIKLQVIRSVDCYVQRYRKE